ncbi:hypothetical protein AB832_00215 [Flavobacteriaceae bacterium (ex Bugula neritina AB1)]|nr:hypothetical protein AB832_00215 [Flavobacteriaceae bacterium (ex Bugula neritina AB1)]
MKRQVIYLFNLISVIFFIGCTNQSEDISALESDIPNDDLYLKNGVLHFKNEHVFFETMEKLRNVSDTEIANWIEKIGFDNSLFLEYIDPEREGDLPIEINDNGFLAILNQDHIYFVKDTYRKITEDFQLVAKNNIPVNQIDWTNSEINRFKIKRFSSKKALQHKEKIVHKTEPYWGDFLDANENPIYSTKNLSAHLVAWNTNYGTHSTYGVRINGRKKRRRKWKDDSMWFASIEARIEFEVIPLNMAVAAFIPNVNNTFVQRRSASGTHQKTVKISGATAVLPVYIHKITADFIYEDDDRPRVHKNDIHFYDVAWWD